MSGCRSPKLRVAEFGQCMFKHVPSAAKHCQCRKLQSWTFQEWSLVAFNWEAIKGASAWQVALFDMLNSNWFDILSISIFSEISLSISIIFRIALSILILISIFSRIALSISIFSKMTISISIFFKSVNISTIDIRYRYIEQGYWQVKV